MTCDIPHDHCLRRVWFSLLVSGAGGLGSLKSCQTIVHSHPVAQTACESGLVAPGLAPPWRDGRLVHAQCLGAGTPWVVSMARWAPGDTTETSPSPKSTWGLFRIPLWIKCSCS